MNTAHSSDVGNKGMFIVFEGGEGSGKSTQARMLADALEQHNIPALLTREPGDTPLGKQLRELLLDRNGEPMSRQAEMLLFAADRAEHVEKVIRPAMVRGEVVICDRYMASTMAYQAYAGGLDPVSVEIVSDFASDGLQPDLTYFLDVSPVIGLERAKRVERTRFEDKTVAYHDKVRRGFLKQRNDSWMTIDAMRSIDDVHNQIVDHTLHVIRVIEAFMSTRARSSFVEDDLGQTASLGVPKKMVERCPVCDKVLVRAIDDPTILICPVNHGWMRFPTNNPEGVWMALTGKKTTCGRDGCIEHPIAVASS